ncbi:MAG: putative MFS family arabinose efflux permease [Paraglaciecola psychrophila]
MENNNNSALNRYLQLAVIVVAAGAIYPLLYLRQNFEVSILQSFGITLSQLSQCYAMLGVIFVLTYLPSGWLADRVSPRLLLTSSLAATGLLGLWFASMPGFDELQIIFAGWGIATGLTFWSAHIKAVALLAQKHEQGRFFGILDGGRGLFEALLATIAVAWFAYALEVPGGSTKQALLEVIYLYVAVLLLMAPLVFFALAPHTANAEERVPGDTFYADLKQVLRCPEIWLCATIIICGYQLFWATYSFSGYLQNILGLSAVTVASITVAKLWMRPIGAAAAGFAGDFLDRQHVLTVLILLASLSLAAMAFLPSSAAAGLMLAVVLLVGLLTYAVRGVYWATLDSCNVPDRTKGLAIGLISLLGYSPDIYLPLYNSALLEAYPGRTGYTIYFLSLASTGLIGMVAAHQLGRRVRRKAAQNHHNTAATPHNSDRPSSAN